MIKYQYLQPTSYDIARQPNLKGLCITIATELEKVDEKLSLCYWTVAFKNPNDQFNKVTARAAIVANESNPFLSGSITLSNNYTRNEILSKILMQLCINEMAFTTKYRHFIRTLILDGSFFNSLVD